MKKSKRKQKSVDIRDLWDGPKCYHSLWVLPIAKLKYMRRHHSRRDRKMKSYIEDILERKKRKKL